MKTVFKRQFDRRAGDLVWRPVFNAGFNDGVNGNAYPTPGGWPAGITLSADWGYVCRAWNNAAEGGMALRYPTQLEGGGSANSQFRTQFLAGDAALVRYGMKPWNKVSFFIKCAVTGGFFYRGLGGSYYFCGALWNWDDTATYQSAITFDTSGSNIAILNKYNRAASWQFTTPSASCNIPTPASGSWHKVDVELFENAARGFIKLYWDGRLVCRYFGDTALAGTTRTLYAFGPGGGGTPQNNDLNYFGALDCPTLWTKGKPWQP